MSILNILLNRSKVNAAAKKTLLARKREGDVAEKLFQEAFQGFQEVAGSDPVIADALYHWGFALFHQAQTKSGEETDSIYQDAASKFSACMTLNPHHLGAAIDWGAVLMEQARNRSGAEQERLYTLAREKFLAANAIQAGTASYNLACIHAIRGEEEACRAALQDARGHGSLPGEGAMLNDADLAAVHHKSWFNEFIESLREKSAPTEDKTGAEGKQPEAAQQQPTASSPEHSVTTEESVGTVTEPQDTTHQSE